MQTTGGPVGDSFHPTVLCMVLGRQQLFFVKLFRVCTSINACVFCVIKPEKVLKVLWYESIRYNVSASLSAIENMKAN